MRANIELGNIQVRNIDTSSGIFIAQTNIANGWRSQTKLNYGFGEIGDETTFENCLSIVSDNDVIDSPMEDNSIMIDKNVSHSNSNTDIFFEGIDVESINTNATVSIGESMQNGWGTQMKNNYGNGEFYGDTITSNNKVLIKDDDLIDAPVNDHHIVNSP